MITQAQLDQTLLDLRHDALLTLGRLMKTADDPAEARRLAATILRTIRTAFREPAPSAGSPLHSGSVPDAHPLPDGPSLTQRCESPCPSSIDTEAHAPLRAHAPLSPPAAQLLAASGAPVPRGTHPLTSPSYSSP
ncbi:MAG: hypothetical protein K2Q09_11190 [Phycisphaerales bacterium]|nr:hypothetical protein [Phycisphaerales bacterium]